MNNSENISNQKSEQSLSKREDKPMFKLNKLFNITLMALCGMLMFISCDEINSTTEKEPPQETEITVKQIQNSENPYDEEGAIHNEFLDYLVEEIGDTKTLDEEKTMDIIKNFYEENKMEFGGEQSQGFSQLFSAYGQLGQPGPLFPSPVDELCRWFPALCDIFNPTGPFIPYALQTDILNDENGATTTERTLKFIEATKEQESKALADREIEEEHRTALLAQYAIARYSAAYWHNAEYIQKESNGYYGDLTDGDAIAKACHTCDVVGSDAAGAAVGSLVPGVGTGVGAGVASAAAVIEKIWSWW